MISVPLWLEIFTTKQGSYFRHIPKGFPHVRIITNATNQFENWRADEFEGVGIVLRKS